ncbi:MAG: hypothetical protein LQ343_000858 [Gyalolechia ehrenbergii]|nr:MAG: hypothetical protein LQ343_000858 [Gyalolechia ehrenbergii]
MRICILQSSRPDGQTSGTTSELETSPNLSRYTEQHIFEQSSLSVDSIEEQIEATLAAKFDLYWTSVYGRLVEEAAEIKVAKYLESLGIPFIGTPSHILEKMGKMSQEQPNTALSCSTPENQTESLESHGPQINRQDSGTAGSSKGNHTSTPAQVSELGTNQDFEDDDTYSILVIAMGSAVTSVPPATPRTKPELCVCLQQVAVATYETAQLQGCPWYTVNIRAQPGGAHAVVGIDLRPRLFSSKGQTWEDAAVEQYFPGGHRALVDSAIVTSQMRYGARTKFERSLEEVYAQWSKKYDQSLEARSDMAQTTLHVCKFSLQGSILDLGCGTGLFGKRLHNARESRAISTKDSCLVGIDLSPDMAAIAKQEGYYHEVRVGSIQKVLPTMPMFNHIVSLTTLHHISTLELSFVLSAAFQKARRSITLAIDDVPEGYNEALRNRGPPHDAMQGHNHLKAMKAYGIPRDWALVDETRLFGWNSPKTGHDIFTTVFRFEHV